MRIIKLLLVLLAVAMVSTGVSSAITPDELAAYLGITSWRTAVELPPNSYTAELYEFVDGKAKDANIIALPEYAKHPEVGFTIMTGSQNGKYRFVVMGWNGTYGVTTEEGTFGSTIGGSLPDKIKEGDFILFGEPLGGAAFHASDDIHSFSKGFLLRVKKHASSP